jgi:hypothetical protein
MSGFALSLAFRPIDSGIQWIAEGSAGLQRSPAALAAIEGIVWLILGPLALGVIVHILNNGLGRTFARILSFWWVGLKSGIVGLLLLLPFIILQQVFKHAAGPDAFTPGSSAGWLYMLFVALLLISAPFWALLLIRHVPTAVLRGSLFERFNPENFDSGNSRLSQGR